MIHWNGRFLILPIVVERWRLDSGTEGKIGTGKVMERVRAKEKGKG